MEMEMRGVRVVGGERDKKKTGGRRLTKVVRDEPKRLKNVEKGNENPSPDGGGR